MSTRAEYEPAFRDAFLALSARVPTDNWPEGERDKRLVDMLNNAWQEESSVEAWVERALADRP